MIKPSSSRAATQRDAPLKVTFPWLHFWFQHFVVALNILTTHYLHLSPLSNPPTLVTSHWEWCFPTNARYLGHSDASGIFQHGTGVRLWWLWQQWGVVCRSDIFSFNLAELPKETDCCLARTNLPLAFKSSSGPFKGRYAFGSGGKVWIHRISWQCRSFVQQVLSVFLLYFPFFPGEQPGTGDQEDGVSWLKVANVRVMSCFCWCFH